MIVMASQITSLTIVYSTVYSKLRVTGLYERNSPVTVEFPTHKGPVKRKMFLFDDVIMMRIGEIENKYVDSDIN